MPFAPYVASVFRPRRRRTREVRVGDLLIGGARPIVVQSMTTSDTKDTKAVVSEIQALAEAGCGIVRLAVPTEADAENLAEIRAEMRRRKIRVPLAADVHFRPEIALRACDFVEKVRINPGNFADRKRFGVRRYSDAEYAAELERIRKAFLPLLRRLKEAGVALRIGTNHGSLSDRIMNRYGDTPLGMVESALEFVRIAQEEGYRDLVLSMKSSNTQVTIRAYRLLVARMNELGMDYPLHLGVTEAGSGEDGRIKSAVGIGSLLADGLGDTIRVSLAEPPVREIPVAKALVRLFALAGDGPAAGAGAPAWDPYSYRRRPSQRLAGPVPVGGGEEVRVRAHFASFPGGSEERERLHPEAEIVSVDAYRPAAAPEHLAGLDPKTSLLLRLDRGTVGDLAAAGSRANELSVSPSGAWREGASADKLESLLKDRTVWLRVRDATELPAAIEAGRALGGFAGVGLEVEGETLIGLGRRAVRVLEEENLALPVHLRLLERAGEPEEDLRLRASAELGSLLCDGIGDSIEIHSARGAPFDSRLSFDILQACRRRMSKTEYIVCPSCGRTLFELEAVAARIRAKTSHLKGVKIAVMGCAVNGPGEMADADFGYVGSGPGRVNLYVGRECVERNIPEAEADRRLVELIRRHGRWKEPA